MSQVSIVIPTLNEASCLHRTLQTLKLLDPPAWEIIIVDGGSSDETVDVARTSEAIVISSKQPRRSHQMNRGAEAATGDILCFLHADTLIPDDAVTVIEQTLSNSTIAAGGFISLMTGVTTHWGISLHNLLKTYYAPLLFRPYQFFFKGLRLLFGDQVIFCRRQDFLDCGGFDPALPIMEDGDLCVRLVKRGRIVLVNRVVQSSDRRVAKWGALRANAIYLYIGFLWGFGVSATYLKKFYEDIR